MAELHDLFAVDASNIARSPRAITGMASQRLVNGPAQTAQAPRDGFAMYPGSLGPLHQGESFAAVRYAVVVRSVVLLLFLSGPAAVARLIAFGIIDAVNRVFGRGAFPHIVQKPLVRTPPLADRAGLVMAPVGQAAPNLIGARLISALGVSVLMVALLECGRHAIAVVTALLESLGDTFFHQAPTRLAIPKDEPRGRNRPHLAALAAAFPKPPSLVRADAFERGKAAEFLIGQVSRCGQGALLYG